MNTEIEKTESGSPVPSPTNPAEAAAPTKATRRSRRIVIGSVALVLFLGLVAGIIPRLRAQNKLAASAQEVVRQSVNVTNATRVGSAMELSLPGDVHAYEETDIHARADGYLLKWYTDIGTKVEAGQLLAEIDSPELDQSLNQSRAALAQAQANLTLARSSAERWQGLLQSHAVSQQEVDEKTSALAARQADVNAAQADVTRLEKLSNFKEVRAPFAGIITGRFVDTGALIHAGGNASALFKLAQMDTMRVHVNVPQAYLRDITAGSPVQVHVAEYPDRSFNGKVVRTSGAFDPTTRTMLTEIEVPNPDGALYSGIHVDVQLSLAQANPPIIVPSTSVMIQSDGLKVAVVDIDDSIRLQKVQVGRDLGQSVEIVAGLPDGARVVTNPTDTLADGVQVKVAGAQAAKTPVAHLAKR